MKVYCFRSSIPPNINTKEKTDIINFFHEGVIAVGDQSKVISEQTYDNCDVGLIIGSYNSQNPTKTRLPHYHVRKSVVEQQLSRGQYYVSADSNVFIYLNKENPKHYLRYSFNGVNPAEGIYCNNRWTDDNWNNIQRDYGINLKPWRKNGNHILVCCQRPLGWSMRGLNLETWLDRTIRKIKKNTDRPILVRWHPGDPKSFPEWQKKIAKYGVIISPTSRHITEDLKKAHAVVCHNSTPSSVAAIEGVPSFITDEPRFSMAGDVVNTDFTQLETPIFPDREQWIRKLSQCHWSFDDLRSGRCWAWMRQWVTAAH